METYRQIKNLIQNVDVHEVLQTIEIDNVERVGGGGNLSLVVTSGVVACIALWAFKNLFGRLASWNLPGPWDSIFILDLFNHNKREHQLHLLLDDYVQSYGRLFAFNHKEQPTVVTCDEEMIRKILWKEFENFQDRKVF